MGKQAEWDDGTETKNEGRSWGLIYASRIAGRKGDLWSSPLDKLACDGDHPPGRKLTLLVLMDPGYSEGVCVVWRQGCE